MLKRMVQAGIWLVVRLTYRAYGVEGLNALLLILPAKAIVPQLRLHGARIGQAVEMHSPLIIHNAQPTGAHYGHLVIGDECYFGRDVLFDLKDRIAIESQVTISMRVTLITHTDVGRSSLRARRPPSQAPIVIRRGAYIGAGALILEGVEIGECTVVAAGAVVTKSVPANVLAAGVPARVLGQRPSGVGTGFEIQ